MSDTRQALEEAISLALSAHSGQRDKGGNPYILHPLRVMSRMVGEDHQIAAVLHDVVEDGDVDLVDIVGQFGTEIADAVDALTRRDGEDYMAFIDRCAVNPIAAKVKMADLEDNMDLSRIRSPLTPADYQRHAKYERAKERLAQACLKARENGDG